MHVRVGCEFVQWAENPVHAVVQVEPRLDATATLAQVSWDPQTQTLSTTYFDGFGNLCRRLTFPPGRSTLRYDASFHLPAVRDPVDLAAGEVLPELLPAETLLFTLPSRFCPSDELGAVAFDLFGGLQPGWSRVQAICDWVHEAVAFGYGTSTPTTTARDVLESRKGVCRDFAHLMVTFCRALGMPAAYVFGYLPDIGVPPPPEPMDFCAWVEVYLGGRWWTFDPRNNARRMGRVLIGRGRDALDVAMVTSFGALLLESMVVWADELPE
jgi:transglutaminase-like putative cysteine protease